MVFTEDSYKNEYVKRAYESVLVLSLMRQTGDLYDKFKSKVKVRALADYGYTLEESETVRRFFLLFRDLYDYILIVMI